MSRRLSRPSLAWLIATLLLAGTAGLSFFVSPQGPARPAAGFPAFDLLGHRGARGHYPENTLPGFEAALALGVTTLEMDVGLTRDGVLVVHHDRRLHPARTRNADGNWLEDHGPALIDMTAESLGRYDVGRLRPDSDYARRFPQQAALDGVRVPSLAAVLARGEQVSGRRIRYSIETKLSPLSPDDSAVPEALAAALVDALRHAGVVERATVQSFDWRSLRQVRDLAPEITTVCLTAERDWLDNIRRGKPGASPWTAGLDVEDFDASVSRLVEAAGCRTWSPYFRDLRAVDLREAKRLGLRVVVWTVNEPRDMASLIDFGVDGIVTDYPDRLRQVMADKKMDLPAGFPASPSDP